jgi:metal-responsive CopG/Arc/MetJ family transcriptional regulator
MQDHRYVSVLFHERVIEAIDNFRFDFRLDSRTEAIRLLIEYALKHQAKAARAARVAGNEP